MRVRILCVLLMSISWVAQGQSYTGDSWEKVSKNKEGSIVMAYAEAPSFVYQNRAGKLTGISVDIINEFVSYVSRTRNVKLEVKWSGEGTDFQSMYNKVKDSQGGVFGLGNITITEARKKEVKFSPAYITNFAILVTQSNVPLITSLNDLSTLFTSLNGYTVKGTTNDRRVLDIQQKYYRKMKVIYAPSSEMALELIKSDPYGLAYIDVSYYLHAMKDNLPIKRHPVGDRLQEKIGFAMPLNSDWGGIMEEFFKADGGFTNSPIYKDILSRHLGKTGLMLLQSGL